MTTLMLGVSGCRGIFGDGLTPEVVARFAGSFAGWLSTTRPGTPTVLVARDGRRGGDMTLHAALAGLLGAGCNVVDLGVATTPTAAVAVDDAALRRGPDAAGPTTGPVAGLVLTASHNPQMWHGLKALVPDGLGLFGSSACAPPAAVADAVLARFRAGQVGLASWDRIGAVRTEAGADELHVERSASALEAAGVADDASRIASGLSVVLDSVNASGVRAGAMMLERLGAAEILHLGCEATGVFDHAPEPVRENLADVARAVRESGSAVGFAQDPDADRLAIIDERGEYIGEEYTLVLGCLAVLEAARRSGARTQGAVLAANLSTSRMIDDLAARYGARVVRTAVGEAHVVGAMKRESALIGGEGNGGVIWPRVTYVRDSLSAMGLVLALLENGRRTLSSIVAGLPAYAIVKRKVDLPSKDAARPALEALARAYGGERVDRQDGVRVDFDSRRAWLHVRASNTEPIMRLIAEAPEGREAENLLDEASRVIAAG